MAKARRKPKPIPRGERQPQAKAPTWSLRRLERALFRHLNKILMVVAGSAILLAGAYFWSQSATEDKFLELALRGRDALSGVETTKDLGRRHLSPGEDFTYFERFPTSGPHTQVWTKVGFYETPQAETTILHAAEHGNVIVYYDHLSPDQRKIMRDWSSLYDGRWDGLVVTPSPGLGERIILVAWNNQLSLDRFEPTSVAAFIDAYRGRGPENPVR